MKVAYSECILCYVTRTMDYACSLNIMINILIVARDG